MLHHFDAGKDIRWTPSGFSVYTPDVALREVVIF